MKSKSKMKYVSMALTLLLAGGLCSCGDTFDEPEEDPIEEPKEEPKEEPETNHFVSADLASAKAVNFLRELREVAGAEAVPSVEATTVRGFGQNEQETRLPAEVAPGDSIAFYVVDLQGGGFVMASADDRQDSVFAYVPEGHFEDAVKGTWGFMQFVTLLSHRTLGGGDVAMRLGSGSGDSKGFVAEMMKTRWGSGEPYNMETGFSTCSAMGVALSQIAAYYQKPASVPYKLSNSSQFTVDLHWDAIMKSNDEGGGHLLEKDYVAKEVSSLIRFIEGGEQYDSFAPTTSEMGRMESLGFYLWNHGQGSLLYSYQTMQSSLRNKQLCYVRGCFVDDQDGMMTLGGVHPSVWVVDGFAGNLMHCNWGMDGLMNGWFLYRVFAEPVVLSFDYKLQFTSVEG